MAIPTQNETYKIVLDLMSDGEKHTRKELKQKTAEIFSLTDAERAQVTSSGVPIYGGRVGWAVSYLSRARLIDRISKGVYVINDEGKKVQSENLTPSDLIHRIQLLIAALDPWNTTTKSKPSPDVTTEQATAMPSSDETESPVVQIDNLVNELNDDLAEEIMALIMERDGYFFERVVVELLEKMGYGKGTVTQKSGDEGIDGLITTDELGFRPIYTQAKRYQQDKKIGRPVVQSFVGALNGANNGVFITTSSFTDEAIEYAKQYPNATLSLIDGKKLTELMIKYGLGVTAEKTIEIKRIDSDYFED